MAVSLRKDSPKPRPSGIVVWTFFLFAILCLALAFSWWSSFEDWNMPWRAVLPLLAGLYAGYILKMAIDMAIWWWERR